VDHVPLTRLADASFWFVLFWLLRCGLPTPLLPLAHNGKKNNARVIDGDFMLDQIVKVSPPAMLADGSPPPYPS